MRGFTCIAFDLRIECIFINHLFEVSPVEEIFLFKRVDIINADSDNFLESISNLRIELVKEELNKYLMIRRQVHVQEPETSYHIML